MKPITKLAPNEVFVFGSNLAGIHGAGAAKTAHRLFGAKMDVSGGPMGQSYGIPTKDHNIKTLPLEAINVFVGLFLDHARSFPDRHYLVTPIGCGLAGYKPEQIAPMFSGAPSNVVLPNEFMEFIIDRKDGGA